MKSNKNIKLLIPVVSGMLSLTGLPGGIFAKGEEIYSAGIADITSGNSLPLTTLLIALGMLTAVTLNERKYKTKKDKKSNSGELDETGQLKERVKELNCLYNISHLLATRKYDKEETLQRLVNECPPSLLYPDKAFAFIKTGGLEIKTDKFDSNCVMITSEIKLDNLRLGEIGFGYPESSVKDKKTPFLKEEYDLLETISKISAHYLQDLHSAAELEKSEERYRSLFEGVPAGLFRTTPEGKFIEANKKLAEIFEVDSREELLKSNAKDYYQNEEDRAGWIKELHNSGEVDNYEVKLKLPNGKQKWVRYSARLLENKETGSYCFEGASIDITDQKLAEEELHSIKEALAKKVKARTNELEAANKELETLAFSISHDLRAPLRTITGFSNILFEDHAEDLDEEAKHLLERIKSASVRMDKMIIELLGFSKISAINPKRSDVNLSDIAHSILNSLKNNYPRTKSEIYIEPNITVFADKDMMTSVMENLLSNAWKYSAGSGCTKIEVSSIRKNRKTVFYVKDHGAGFDIKKSELLFKPFSRLHGSEFPGNGIGLASVKRIVDRHGGKIWAYSEQGKGATFFVEI